MRSEEVHKAMLHGATKFELCQLVIRGVRDGCRSSRMDPRDCIGLVLQGLASDPTASVEFHLQCLHLPAAPGGIHATA